MVSRLSLMLVLTARLMGQQLDEYHVKAAFLYNFSKFVDWPPEAFRNAGGAFEICILGKDPFGHALDAIVADQSVGGRLLTVRRISATRQACGCHILFVSSMEGKRVYAILAAAKQPGLLTVGDAGSSPPQSVINFTSEDGKVRFEINTAAADRAGLHISAKLLNLAQAAKRSAGYRK